MIYPDELHLRELLEGESQWITDSIRTVMADPETSTWVKSNLLHLLQCDPAQVMPEVTKLYTLCRERVLRPREFPKKNPKPI